MMRIPLQNLTFLILFTVSCSIFTGIFSSPTYASEKYEPQQVLKASDILPWSFFESDLYKVDQKVINDGLMNTYTVTSKHGNFEVTSNVALYKLIVEIEAIDAMKMIEESDTFTKSLKESGAGTVDGIKHLFTDPEESLKGAGKGLTSLFSRAGEAIFQSSPGETEDSRAKQLIGFSQSKRELAHKFHVDVYSTNKVLQDQLDTLAWADYGGGITISIATLPLGGPAKVVYSSSNVARLLNEAIAMTPPSELKKQNREKLAKMQIDPNLSDLFINNLYLSPRQQTYIVAALELMSDTANREVVLMVALQVQDSDMAMAITTITMMYAGYNNNVAKIKNLYPVMRIMGGTDAKGNKILVVPVDYMTWNSRVAGALEEIGNVPGSGKAQIWLLGRASDLARERLKEMGWQVLTNVADTISVNEIGLLKETKKNEGL